MTANNIAAWWVKIKDSTLTIQDIKLSRKANSLDSVSEAYSSGVYTTFRTYQHDHVLLLESHFNRLEESAGIINGNIQVPRGQLRLALRKILSDFYPDKDIRIRIALNLEDQSYIISAEPLKPPPASAYQKGVSVITCRLERKNPHAKTTDFIATAARIRSTLPPKIQEAIMVDENGYLLEGLSSNFWGVVNGVVRTEKEKVLGGITRSVILELCEKEGIPLLFESIHIRELTSLHEAFITSTSRAVLPVTCIDHHIVGEGKPGKITQLLARCYQEYVTRQIEKI